MRITGRQLRRIIQEEVARMVNEEEVTFTQPAAVQGQAPGALPQGINPASIAKSIAYKLTNLARQDWNAESDVIFNDGDKVSIVGKIVDVTSYDPNATARLFGGSQAPTTGELPMAPKISITSVSVNGQEYSGPNQAKIRASGTLPPDSQMDITATFTVPGGFASALVQDRMDIRKVGSMLTPLIQQTIKVT
jgi:hypothetical protein